MALFTTAGLGAGHAAIFDDNRDLRTDSVRFELFSPEPEADPAVPLPAVVPEKARGAAVLAENQVGVAVAVDVAECRSAGHHRTREIGRGGGHLVESAVSPVPEEMGRLPVGDPLLDVGDVVLDVSVGDEDVLAAVEVVVEEEGPERQGEQAVPADLRHRRLVDEEADSFVVVERDHLVREVADDEVGPSVAVVVGSVDAHGPAGGAVLGESDPGENAGVLEPAAPDVPVEVVGLGVVRHREVGKAVAVEVEIRHPEALATRVEEAGRLRDVGEAVVGTVVPVEDGARPVIRLRGAVALVDAVERAEDVLLDGPLHVVQEEEVEVAVAVGVEPGGAARKARMGHRLRCGSFPEDPRRRVFSSRRFGPSAVR